MQGYISITCVIVLSMVCLSQGNWYGKRGSEVDDAFQRYLEGRITKSTLQMNADRELINKILQLLRDWQIKKKSAGLEAATFEQK